MRNFILSFTANSSSDVHVKLSEVVKTLQPKVQPAAEDQCPSLPEREQFGV